MRGVGREMRGIRGGVGNGIREKEVVRGHDSSKRRRRERIGHGELKDGKTIKQGGRGRKVERLRHTEIDHYHYITHTTQ